MDNGVSWFIMEMDGKMQYVISCKKRDFAIACVVNIDNSVRYEMEAVQGNQTIYTCIRQLKLI